MKLANDIQSILAILFIIYVFYLGLINTFIPTFKNAKKTMKAKLNLSKPLKAGKYGDPDYLHKANTSIQKLIQSKNETNSKQRKLQSKKSEV